MKNHNVNVLLKLACFAFLFVLLMSLAVLPAFAEEAPAPDATVEAEAENAAESKNGRAFAAALTVGVTASIGAVAMGFAIMKAVDSIARQPEAESKIRTALMLGLVFVETAIIYALIVAVLIIFVL